MFDKKGQGLSLNVIIIAALALIILVVLVMVFTGRIGIFEKGVSQESKAELIQMKISYGDCHPTSSDEAAFSSEFEQAESLEAKDEAKATFRDVIDDCRSFNEKSDCEANNCRWD